MAKGKVQAARRRLKQRHFTIPSPDEVSEAQSGNGGWTAKQLAEWGIGWPPPKGWREELRRRWENAGAREGAKTESRIRHPRICQSSAPTRTRTRGRCAVGAQATQ